MKKRCCFGGDKMNWTFAAQANGTGALPFRVWGGVNALVFVCTGGQKKSADFPRDRQTVTTLRDCH